MIHILNKQLCCGCGACEQICPKQCIKMAVDKQGFGYPIVDTSICISCGLCERVCPFTNPYPKSEPIYAFGAKNTDESIRQQSSSGGIFYALAAWVISQNGLVYGAAFDESWKVRHQRVDTIERLSLLQGSKYAQSENNHSYKLAKKDLDFGKIVLYSGTPCQISGLKRFLNKGYDNLITVDIACHGVPSPKIWREWLKYYCSIKNVGTIHSLSFRYKYPSAKNYSTRIVDGDGKEYVVLRKDNTYMRGFLKNLFVRPSCFHCQSKSEFISDLTIADFWGLPRVQPSFDDNRGVSLVLVNSAKGKDIIEQISSTMSIIPVDIKVALRLNTALTNNAKATKYSEKFWQSYKKDGIKALTEVLSQASRFDRINQLVVKFKRVVSKMLNNK